jgi:hypothetical protein
LYKTLALLCDIFDIELHNSFFFQDIETLFKKLTKFFGKACYISLLTDSFIFSASFIGP